MRSTCFAIAFAMTLAAVPALALAPAGQRVNIRGTVEKLDGHTLMVKDRDGKTDTVTLAKKIAIRGVVKKTLADIHQGDFVASTSVKGADGKLHAIEIHIFPPTLKGVVPELQTPWDLVPGSIMTNAIVTGIAAAPKGNTLKVTFKGHETEVIVPPNIPIVSYVPGGDSLLKPGAAVFIIALKKPDGSLTTASVTAEKNGVKPPM
ncbi:MAG TPA: hypothetical protein VMU87_07080 [Stellaceae bacterium]|nr:hypothetical protein [Stellaceae bacterium]